MKKNAILIAGIMFVAGCATGQGSYRADVDSTPTSGSYVSSDFHGTEVLPRDSQGNVNPMTPLDDSTALQYDPAIGGFRGTTSGSGSSSDIKADSSRRGGSMESRGYSSSRNEVEPDGKEMNKSFQADSSIRGGSMESRGYSSSRNEAEPDGKEMNKSFQADSSIRGGSREARGGRELTGSVDSQDMHLQGGVEAGSNVEWSSDMEHQPDRNLSNWNPSDDLMRDGISADVDDLGSYELDSGAAVGGAAESEVGSATSTAPGSELNSSDQLEENISGDYDLPEDKSPGSSTASAGSEQPSDTTHSPEEMQRMEAAGAAAGSETGTVSEPGAADATTHGPNFLYRDNRAHGVGSLSTGEFGEEAASQERPLQEGQVSAGKESLTDEALARKVKARLVTESTGTHGLMRHEAAKNVKVSAEKGIVTLSGSVRSEQDKGLVEIRAAEVAGVQKVINRLSVVNPPEALPQQNPGIGHDLEDSTDQLQD